MEVARLRVLLVEDQEGNIEAWKDKAASHNSDAAAKGFEIRTVTARSVQAAREVLQDCRVDAVVVDLRLHADDQAEPNDHGNALVQYARQEHPVAIAIYSGQAQEADISDCPQVEVFDRGGGLDPVFGWLAAQRDMLTRLRATRDEVERATARIFFKSIWPRWTHWVDKAKEDFGSVLARHVVAHIHDTLLDANNGEAHPEETYFRPPIKERLDTGDLIKVDDVLWVVVTPRCDLANSGKVETVLIARCAPITSQWLEKDGKNQQNLAQHGRTPKQHFLPPMRDTDGKVIGPWMVQFHDLRVIPISEVPEHLTAKRWASLAPQFVPSLVERFGAYFSRIGTPNLSSE